MDNAAFCANAESGTPAVTLNDIMAAIQANDGNDCSLSTAESGALTVHGVCIDSRKATPGCLFVCKGATFKPEFLAAAVKQGTAAFLCQGEMANGRIAVPADLAQAAPGVPAIAAKDIRRAMARASAKAYGAPDENLTVVGVTGTKGKSTTTYMLHAIMNAAEVETSMLGSIETDDGMEHFESHNTTPESPDLWRHLRNTVDAGRKHMVMEVSSQGLKYDRVLGLNFDIACFLNIGRDHISPIEHPTFEDYFASKLRIFDQCKTAVVNLETDHLSEVLKAAEHAEKLVTVGINNPKATLNATGVSSVDGVIRFTVRDSLGETVEERGIALGIAGLFNVENALCAIAIARLLGIDYDAIETGLAHVKVPGRMEVIRCTSKPITAIVDYAHNKLSFETLFSSIKQEYPGQRIIAVFGAAGGKAYERREVLPQTAGKYADLLIFAEEDPAHERPEDICAELAKNTPEGVAHEIIIDREEAFKRAVEIAGDGKPTVIAFLAKGEEELQHRGDAFEPIKSDSAIAHEVLDA